MSQRILFAYLRGSGGLLRDEKRKARGENEKWGVSAEKREEADGDMNTCLTSDRKLAAADDARRRPCTTDTFMVLRRRCERLGAWSQDGVTG
jgi:hypothetical protein